MDLLVELVNSNGLRAATYIIAALLCAFAGERARRSRRAARSAALTPVFWFTLSIVLVTLAVGRIGDLGPWITDRGRDVAKAQGWYDERRRYQKRAVELVAFAGLFLLAIGFVWLFRAAAREEPLAFTAIVFLVCFVLIRAISLHQIDSVLYNDYRRVRPNAVLELAGTLFMIVAAAPAAFARPALWPST